MKYFFQLNMSFNDKMHRHRRWEVLAGGLYPHAGRKFAILGQNMYHFQVIMYSNAGKGSVPPTPPHTVILTCHPFNSKINKAYSITSFCLQILEKLTVPYNTVFSLMN